MRRLTPWLFALALLTLTACEDPLPPEAQWLAGRWQWTGSCCGLGGLIFVPSADYSLTLDLHHNGEAEIHWLTGDVVDDWRTRFEVDITRGDTLIRFGRPLMFERSRFKVSTRTRDNIGFVDDPPACVDCPSSHGFVRVP